jgi:hypothetical protein
VLACVTVAGGFSVWSMFSRPKSHARQVAIPATLSMLLSIPANVSSLCNRSIFPSHGSPDNQDSPGGRLCLRRLAGSIECCPRSTDRLRRVHQAVSRSARTTNTCRIVKTAGFAVSPCVLGCLRVWSRRRRCHCIGTRYRPVGWPPPPRGYCLDEPLQRETDHVLDAEQGLARVSSEVGDTEHGILGAPWGSASVVLKLLSR